VEDTTWQALDPPQRRRWTLDAVRRLLLRETQVQPLLLVVEDLHWIDTETQALLDGLVESLPSARVLLLVNYRPEYQHVWGSKTYYSQLRLDALSPESAAGLLGSLLGDHAELRPLAQLLIDRTEGNPFFLEESVRTLVETQALQGQRGAYRLARAVASIRVPTTVQAVLAARIDRLPPEEKQLLQSASVVGKDVPFPLLHAIAGASEDELRRGLTRLQAAEFLYEASLFPELEYTFKHALTHEVAYGSLLGDRRRVLHVRVLEALERLFADRTTECVERLAHHAVHGERWHPAARYLYLAGEKALACGAYKAAASFYGAAVDAIERQGETQDAALKFDAYLELWVAAIEIGQIKDLPTLAARAEALAIALNDPVRLAQVRVRQAQAHWWFWGGPDALDSAIQRAHEAFGLADPRDLRTRSYARFVIAAACRDLGRFEEAVREFEASAALLADPAPQAETPGLVLPVYVTIRALQAETHAVLGEFPKAIAVASDGLRMANRIAHAPSLALASALLGYVLIQRGEVEAALPVLEQGLAIGEENGFMHAIVANALYLAYGLARLGQQELGLTRLARAIRAAEPTGYDITPWTKYGIVTASTYLAADRLTDATAETAQGLALVTERNARGHRAPLLRLHAELLAREDLRHGADAVRHFEEALSLAAELGMRPELAHCHFGLGKLYRRSGKRQQAQEHLTTATTMYREMGMRFWLEQAEVELRVLA
jgi:tetratricopeptide (TPR) repeat protein